MRMISAAMPGVENIRSRQAEAARFRCWKVFFRPSSVDTSGWKPMLLSFALENWLPFHVVFVLYGVKIAGSWPFEWRWYHSTALDMASAAGYGMGTTRRASTSR